MEITSDLSPHKSDFNIQTKIQTTCIVLYWLRKHCLKVYKANLYHHYYWKNKDVEQLLHFSWKNQYNLWKLFCLGKWLKPQKIRKNEKLPPPSKIWLNQYIYILFALEGALEHLFWLSKNGISIKCFNFFQIAKNTFFFTFFWRFFEVLPPPEGFHRHFKLWVPRLENFLKSRKSGGVI